MRGKGTAISTIILCMGAPAWRSWKGACWAILGSTHLTNMVPILHIPVKAAPVDTLLKLPPVYPSCISCKSSFLRARGMAITQRSSPRPASTQRRCSTSSSKPNLSHSSIMHFVAELCGDTLSQPRRSSLASRLAIMGASSESSCWTLFHCSLAS